MRTVPFPAFLGSDYRAASPTVATSRLVNWMVERTESATDQEPFPASLVPTPGLEARWTGLKGPIRGLFAQDGRVFAVGGRGLYELSGNGASTLLGQMQWDDHPATMATNGHGGHQLLITSGGFGYIFDLSTGQFQQITDTGFPSNAVMCDYLDGYFIVMQATTSTFFLSALDNGLVWSPIQAGQVTSSSDTLQACRVIQRTLWVLGSQRSEVWVNTSGSFPLAPLPGGLSEFGLGAIWSVAEADGTLCFVGANAQGGAIVLQNQGYGFRRISTDSEERYLASVPDLQNTWAYSYQEAGATLYVLMPPTGPALVYNLKTGLWHRQGVWHPGLGAYGPLRQQVQCYGFGAQLVGDRSEGTVYVQSSDYGTDSGIPIRRERQAPHVNASQQWMFGSQVTIGADTGLATSADPVLSLSYSTDGGLTFSTPRDASLGLSGQYGRLVRWLRAPGRFYDLVLRVTTTTETPIRVRSCDLRLEAGTGQR